MDQSVGSFVRPFGVNIPGQKDPVVHFQTVIPKAQLMKFAGDSYDPSSTNWTASGQDTKISATYGTTRRNDWFGDFMNQRNDYMQNNPGKGDTLPKGRGMGDTWRGVDSGKNRKLSIAHRQLEGELLSENKLRILKEIKKPVVLIEASPKEQKLKGYKPNFKGRFSPQNTPDVTACPESDKLVASGNAKGQTWRTQDKYWSGYESQERLNIVRDRVGHGQQAWDMIVDEARQKNGWKNREIQEQLNIIEHEKAMRKIDPDFESPWTLKEMEDPNKHQIDRYMNDPLVKRVRDKLLTQIDYDTKPSRKGYPDEPPAEIDPNTGMHPKYGKKYKYDKLDPVSAITMRNVGTGDPEIDANVEKAANVEKDNTKKKYVNPKVTESVHSSWKSDWRDSLTNA